jgi:hypothetical protein
VVPPNRALPPPQSGTVGTNNPAWPKDPDVIQRRKEATAVKRKPYRTAAEADIESSRALRPGELERGRVAPGTVTGKPQDPDESARPLKPAELGSKGIFSGLFTGFGSDKGETAPFTAEPPRADLTAPPPGYQIPSPNQPYGVVPKDVQAKPATLESRAVGSN